MKIQNPKERARQLKRDVPAVFLALKASETPIIAKIFAGITIAYALSPIDLIPDFIPILGYLDDVILLPVLIALTISFIPKETFEKYKKEAEFMWQSGKPKKWYYGIPVIVIWMLILWFVIRCYYSLCNK